MQRLHQRSLRAQNGSGLAPPENSPGTAGDQHGCRQHDHGSGLIYSLVAPPREKPPEPLPLPRARD